MTLCFPEPVQIERPVEHMPVGHFAGERMSTGRWRLTVLPADARHAYDEWTPQIWWRQAAQSEFSLHGFSDDGTYIESERDDVESPYVPIQTRMAATRWLKLINEAYQNWRMEHYT